MSWGPKGQFPGGGDNGPWGRPKPPQGQPGGPSGGRTPPSGNDFDDLLRRGQDRFRGAFNGGGDNRRTIGLAIGAAALLWLLSGIYTVDSSEQGVELIFGRVQESTEPGLHYNFPAPIGRTYTPNVTASNKEEIGFRSTGSGKSNMADRPEESVMLTGDKNLVKIYYEVQWHIGDAAKYLFEVRDPDLTVKPIAESAMREVVGMTPIDTVLSNEKERIALETQTLMQKTLDAYGTGIEIERVIMLEADAPGEVVEAFIDVLAAQQEFTTLQERARRYREGQLPVAKGDAEKMVLDADAYKQEVVNRAEGDVARFLSVYAQYQQAPDVTRKRMYLETMEKIMKDMPKVILDEQGKGNGVLPYLPLPEIRKTPKPARSEESPS